MAVSATVTLINPRGKEPMKLSTKPRKKYKIQFTAYLF